ncbi:MAG: alpha-ketoacid dehydrogenase subunit beta [Candidatus Omnitrophica bacterium]|nr:alpha-ketoacid dehydrogenase subunit beta [Candidatus Omnitrophota bacterium]
MPTKTKTEKAIRLISYAEAIREATAISMRKDPSVLVVGEGVPDPKGIFGTTLGLREEFGAERVLDMPLSENAMTGALIGLALAGFRPVMVHQRVDFTFLAMDQMVNNAAKWHFMFNGKGTVPLVIRVLIGRGWGQGPQHSQSLQALFAHVPGLKVVMPSTPSDAKGMLISAIEDNNPVIFMEHRWLHGFKDEVPEGIYRVPLDKARVVRKGGQVTVASLSYMTIEALRASKYLESHGIEAEVIDLRSVNPLDTSLVVDSVKKTGHLLVCDTAWKTGGVSGEILAQVSEKAFNQLKKSPRRIALGDHPIPTSHFLASDCYPEAGDIVTEIGELLGLDKNGLVLRGVSTLRRQGPLDVPAFDFKGPF